MNALAIVTFCLAVAIANAGYYGGPISLVGPPAPGVALKGPSAKAALIGPDGSHISAYAPGGAVIAPPKPGGVVTASVVPGTVGIGYGHGLVAPVIAPIAYGGYGLGHLEGQWAPDYTEKLYDDGSYKPGYYH